MIRPFAREHRRLDNRLRYGLEPDQKARLEGALRSLRNIPRELITDRHEIINFVHKQARVIEEVSDGLQEIKPSQAKTGRISLPQREQRREITVAKGRRVPVIERGPKRQFELAL